MALELTDLLVVDNNGTLQKVTVQQLKDDVDKNFTGTGLHLDYSSTTQFFAVERGGGVRKAPASTLKNTLAVVSGDLVYTINGKDYTYHGIDVANFKNLNQPEVAAVFPWLFRGLTSQPIPGQPYKNFWHFPPFIRPLNVGIDLQAWMDAQDWTKKDGSGQYEAMNALSTLATALNLSEYETSWDSRQLALINSGKGPTGGSGFQGTDLFAVCKPVVDSVALKCTFAQLSAVIKPTHP